MLIHGMVIGGDVEAYRVVQHKGNSIFICAIACDILAAILIEAQKINIL
jgi:hypothetical protein